MSKIALQGDVNGTGTFTIASPNSNNNRTFDLPDNSGTVLTTGATITAAQGGTGLTSPGANGNVLTSNGTTWTSVAPAVVLLGPKIQVYAASGTYTFNVPSNVNSLYVEVYGGGGGGKGGGDPISNNSLGGQGATVGAVITGLTPGAAITVTVGAGGAGGAAGSGFAGSNGNTGGTSSFGTYITCTGGVGQTVTNVAGATGTVSLSGATRVASPRIVSGSSSGSVGGFGVIGCNSYAGGSAGGPGLSGGGGGGGTAGSSGGAGGTALGAGSNGNAGSSSGGSGGGTGGGAGGSFTTYFGQIVGGGGGGGCGGVIVFY